MQYRKKPVVIEAEQMPRFKDGRVMEQWVTERNLAIEDHGDFCYIYVPTLEGRMRINPGDWLITGIKGEKYPCKPDIFEATYEPVEAR